MEPGFEIGSRAANLERLREGVFDVLIVGGGINGAGIARDLVLRAHDAGRDLRVGLIEKRQFSSGTSGRNSQLIHGGLRYLKNLEFGLVREALRERATLLKLAPHLVEPLPLLIPYYSRFDHLLYGTGLAVYDFLAGRRNIGRRRPLGRSEVTDLEPDLAAEGLVAGAIFYDCRVNSARLVLENVADAARLGAVAANYVESAGWSAQDDGFLVEARDKFTGQPLRIRARRLVDARGPWEDGGGLRLVRGSHIVLPRLTQSENAIAFFGADGRIVFVIPWGPKDSLSLVGTTDADHDAPPDAVRISPEEVRYLMATVHRLFPSCGNKEPLAAYSSLRPLVASGTGSATGTSRKHSIRLDRGVLKIAGGKYTTYRSMAEEAVDLLMPETRGRCRTAVRPLGGGETEALRRRMGPVAYAVHHEMAQRLPDAMFVSTYAGHEQRHTRESLLPAAREMAALLGWDSQRVETEISLTLEIARLP